MRQPPALLLPREHGAWGQVLLPLATALAAGAPGPAAVLLSIAALGAFLGHEALLVLLGQRGPRLRQRYAQLARRTLWCLAPLATVALLGGMVLAPATARLAAAAILPAILILALVIASGREKTTLGEALAASTAAVVALPVAAAAGVSLGDAVTAWLVWTLAFGGATGGVRWLLAGHKGKPDRAAPVLLVVCTVATVVSAVRLPLFLAALPQIVLAWSLVIGRPHPRSLKRIGWSLVAASLVTAGVLVAATG